MNRTEAALAVGMAYSQFCEWLNGAKDKSPKIRNLDRFAEQFKALSVAELVDPRWHEASPHPELTDDQALVLSQLEQMDDAARQTIRNLAHRAAPDATAEGWRRRQSAVGRPAKGHGKSRSAVESERRGG